MYRRHTFEERLLIISRLICGESLEAICREGKLDKRWFANGFFAMRNMEMKVFEEQGHIIIQP